MRYCHPECRQIRFELKGEHSCFARKQGNCVCYVKNIARKWIKLTRREPTNAASPFLLEFHQHIRHKEIACYPSFHVKPADAILDPAGNELWVGVPCNRAHAYDANLLAYQQCFAMTRRVTSQDLRLVFSEALIDLLPKNFDDRRMIGVVTEMLMGETFVRTKLIREATRVQSIHPMESEPWIYAQYVRIAADHFDRHREECSRESLGTLRELFLAVDSRDPAKAQRIAQTAPFEDEKPSYFKVQSLLLARLYRKVGSIPQIAPA